jgi:uncharacterized integral membrane protein
VTGDPDPLVPTPGKAPEKARRGGPLAKENRRLVAGIVLGAAVAAFAVVNLDEVQVDWIVGSAQTPLIIVIGVAFALGAGIGWLAGAKRRSRKSSANESG